MSDAPAARSEPLPRRLLLPIIKNVALLAILTCLVSCLIWILWEDSTQNQLIRNLQSGNIDDRVFAACQLAAAPSPGGAEKVIRALIAATGDESSEVRQAAVYSLGSSVRQLIDSWNKQPDEVKRNLPLATAASRAAIKATQDPDDLVKAEALRALLAIHVEHSQGASFQLVEPILAGVEPEELRAALVNVLADLNPFVRAQAADVLAKLGPRLSSQVPPELVAALEDSDAHVREEAGGACDSYKEALSPHLQELFEKLEQAMPPIRFTLWNCLEGATAEPTLVPFLRERLKSKSPEVRSAAASILGRMGPKAAEATRELLALLDEPYVPTLSYAREPDPARSAARALSSLSPTPEIVNALIAHLHSSVKGRREEAAYALRDMGPAARPPVPPLLAILREASSKGELAPGISYALARIAPDTEYAEEVIAVLMESLEAKNVNLRYESAWYLGQIGPPARAALPLLRRLAQENDARNNAREAIQKIEKGQAGSDGSTP